MDEKVYSEEQIAVVVVVTIHHDQTWTAYVAPYGFNKTAAVEFGIRLTEREARIFFPTLQDKPYRP